MAYYEGMTKIGAYSPNRVLELEDENTIGPDGDIHTMQSQNVTLERIADEVTSGFLGAVRAQRHAVPGRVQPDRDVERPLLRRIDLRCARNRYFLRAEDSGRVLGGELQPCAGVWRKRRTCR